MSFSHLLGALLLLGTSSALSSTDLHAQNSTRKIRVDPSDIAARAGSAIAWRTDLDAAIKESKRSKKPVFWYIPTIDGSFMDRKQEIDGYMMAGPFSWPGLVQLINQNYIPIRLSANRKLCKRFKLAPVTFVEPGFLILNSKGKELSRVDRISTLHPGWFQTQLGVDSKSISSYPGGLPESIAANLYQNIPRLKQGRAEAFELALSSLEPDQHAAAYWIHVAGLRDQQLETDARALLQRILSTFPQHALASKAAMELEGHGPYWRGFESYQAIPASLLQTTTSGTLAPSGAYTAEELQRRSIEFLLRTQEADGSWRDSTYDFGGTDSLPNVYAAVTAINARGLIANEQGKDALTRALTFLADDSHLNLEDRDELVWAYIYRIRLYCDILRHDIEQRDELIPLLSNNVDALIAMQENGGSWYHEYSNPFVTASSLIALADAKQYVIWSIDDRSPSENGLIALEHSRSKKGAYSYAQGRGKIRTPVEASVGRSPVGEHARQLWGVAGKKDLETAVRNSFRDQEPLFLARKYDDHTNVHAYGGFFFWYSMMGRTEAIMAMPEGTKKMAFMQQQRDLILALPEIDGAFVDSHELGRSYGTGMALSCLRLLQKK